MRNTGPAGTSRSRKPVDVAELLRRVLHRLRCLLEHLLQTGWNGNPSRRHPLGERWRVRSSADGTQVTHSGAGSTAAPFKAPPTRRRASEKVPAFMSSRTVAPQPPSA
jgi:hypothetical protein